jgi:hypothetical protein
VLNWNGSAFTWSAGTISGVALGSNLNALTFGTFLTGTSYNGSSAVTIATNATNANTAGTIVARDGSGNFSAGTITAALSGNATTATTATNVSGTVAVANGGTGQTTLTSLPLPQPVITQNMQVIGSGTTAVASRVYVLTASLTLTLPASPAAGNWVSVSNRSGTTTPVIARNGQNIMGLAEDMTIDNSTASFTLTFADATRGWVLTL